MKKLVQFIFLCSIPLIVPAQSHVADYNVVWDTPSQDSWGSMPAGNGDVGANVWMDENGSLHFYISKTDAWSENARLLKVGKLKLDFEPNPFVGAEQFTQTLELDKGWIRIQSINDQDTACLILWVDAHYPVVHIDVQSDAPLTVKVKNDMWRTRKRELKGPELRSAYGLIEAPFRIFVEPDILVSGLDDQLQWYHRNERSVYDRVLTGQDLDGYIEQSRDPLLTRTFGATVFGAGMKTLSSKELVSDIASDHAIDVWVQTTHLRSAEEWKMTCRRGIDSISARSREGLLRDHVSWWQQFWDRHWIYIHSNENADSVYRMTQGYHLQRYISACGGRGAMPIKFNGSIFTVDLVQSVGPFPAGYDADFRNWGGCYWFQNTRLPYWAMLHSGDFECMKPLFTMYFNALDLARYRTRQHYGHEGVGFPETMYFWGTWNLNNYGWERHELSPGISRNMYIRHEWQGGIELIAMMLDYYDFTRHPGFLSDTLIPFTQEILLFYDRHYERDSLGRIIFDPAQALETYWEGTINPMPEISGLHFILPRFIDLENEIADDRFLSLCRRLSQELPDVPIRITGHDTLLVPAEKLGKKSNIENPELYAVFPYRLYGIGKPHLSWAQNSYANRLHKDFFGWQQDAIQAAYLGNSEEAARFVKRNLNTHHEGSRFLAFWGPNYDWIPDQDHGSVNMRALQNMIIQTEGRNIYILPAWPDHWDLEFRVHAPYNTTITGFVRDGEMVKMHVEPQERLKDIIIQKK